MHSEHGVADRGPDAQPVVLQDLDVGHCPEAVVHDDLAGGVQYLLKRPFIVGGPSEVNTAFIIPQSDLTQQVSVTRPFQVDRERRREKHLADACAGLWNARNNRPVFGPVMSPPVSHTVVRALLRVSQVGGPQGHWLGAHAHEYTRALIS